MTTSVLSKIGAPKIRIGTIQPIWVVPSLRLNKMLMAAIISPRNMAPLSPMKIDAGLKFHFKKPRLAPKVAADIKPNKPWFCSRANIKKKQDARAASPAREPIHMVQDCKGAGYRNDPKNREHIAEHERPPR